jgi:hypothetical protein
MSFLSRKLEGLGFVVAPGKRLYAALSERVARSSASLFEPLHSMLTIRARQHLSFSERVVDQEIIASQYVDREIMCSCTETAST